MNMFHMRPFFLFVVFVFFMVIGAGSFARGAAPKKPNVLILMTDDQGYGELSVHGNPVLRTPNLDRLHDESIRLTNFHVAPMCTPTRGQLMSGIDCLRNGAMNVSSGRTLLKRGIPVMPEFLREMGYDTGIFGKWHLGDNYPYRPDDRGFRECVWFPSSHIGSVPDYWDNDYFDDVYRHNEIRERFHGYTTDVFFDQAMRWMKTVADSGKPFLCYLPTAAPHSPHFVPASYREAMAERVKQLQLNNIDEKTLEQLIRYLAMIENIDENVGRLESFLSANNLKDDTIFIFLTDNGSTFGPLYFNAGMRGGKVTLWEGGHRVPCFIRWPSGDLRAPGEIPGLCAVQDLLPTILELTGRGVSRHDRFDGLSLANVLRGNEDPPEDRKLVVQFSRMNRPDPVKNDACVLWRDWRLVHGKELYDLSRDPMQKNNVIADRPEIAEKLQKHYDFWWDDLASGVNEPQPVVVGHDESDDLLSPCEWWNVFLDLSNQVRKGVRRGGRSFLEIARSGEYEIELRRWPRERERPFRATMPETPIADGVFLEGVSLPIHYVRLAIGDYDETLPVDEKACYVTFQAALREGPVEMRACFLDEHREEICGAYFVYVRRKDAAPPNSIDSK